MGIVKRRLNDIFVVTVAEASDPDHNATLLVFTTAFGWMAVMVFCAISGILIFGILESESISLLRINRTFGI
jgi:hypothetical protein